MMVLWMLHLLVLVAWIASEVSVSDTVWEFVVEGGVGVVERRKARLVWEATVGCEATVVGAAIRGVVVVVFDVTV